MLKEFLEAAASQVDKGIYVWGGNGKNLLCMDDPISWIRKRETTTANANRAIALFENRVADGIDPILAFDCSGFIYWCYTQAKLGLGRRNAATIYSSYCKPVDKAEPADLVFHYSASDRRIVHVGMYVGDDTVIEARGRDYGVVATEYAKRVKSGYWNRIGRLKKLKDEYGVTLRGDANCDGRVTAADASAVLRYVSGIEDLTEQGKLNADYNQDGKITKDDAQEILDHIVGLDQPAQKVRVLGKSVNVRNSDSTKGKVLGVAHKGDTFAYRATAPSGWYEIDYKGMVGYISNRADLTKLE